MYIHVSIQLDMFTDLHSFTFLFNDPKFWRFGDKSFLYGCPSGCMWQRVEWTGFILRPTTTTVRRKRKCIGIIFLLCLMGAITMFSLNKCMQIATRQLRKASPQKDRCVETFPTKIWPMKLKYWTLKPSNLSDTGWWFRNPIPNHRLDVSQNLGR